MAGGRSTVLVVDDKPANLLAFEALLTPNHDVVSVTSGELAIDAFRSRRRIDVVLMDVQMPGMDGFETAAEIKKLEQARDVPIIFVTAVYSEDPFVRRGYEAGGIDYFSKPFDPEILKLKVGIYAAFRQRETVLKERERQVRESEELLRVGRKLSAMLESVPVGVLIADAQGRVCQATDAVNRILSGGHASEREVSGDILGWWERHGHALRQAGGPLARAIAGETSHSEQIPIVCLDGTARTILLSASPLRGLDRAIVGAVVLVQDLTETRRIEEALEERVVRLVGAGVELEETVAR